MNNIIAFDIILFDILDLLEQERQEAYFSVCDPVKTIEKG